jgi:hypothetical protein
VRAFARKRPWELRSRSIQFGESSSHSSRTHCARISGWSRHAKPPAKLPLYSSPIWSKPLGAISSERGHASAATVATRLTTNPSLGVRGSMPQSVIWSSGVSMSHESSRRPADEYAADSFASASLCYGVPGLTVSDASSAQWSPSTGSPIQLTTRSCLRGDVGSDLSRNCKRSTSPRRTFAGFYGNSTPRRMSFSVEAAAAEPGL